MKIVTLNGPAVIAGAIRYPVEGSQTVTDAEAKRLKDGGFLDGEPTDLDDEQTGEDVGDGLDNETVADLKATAEAEGIDLGEATKKADILAAIRAARAAS